MINELVRMNPKRIPQNPASTASPKFLTLVILMPIIALLRRQIVKIEALYHSSAFARPEKDKLTKVAEEARNPEQPIVASANLFPKREIKIPLTIKNTPIGSEYRFRSLASILYWNTGQPLTELYRNVFPFTPTYLSVGSSASHVMLS